MPRKKRWPKPSKSSPLAVGLRPAKRKQWTDEQMTKALAATSEGMPANRAATMYGVPKSTLTDRVSGRVVHGTKPGPRPYLDPDEEKELSSFLVSSAECGYGKTRQEVLTIVEKVANDKKILKGNKVSDGWWRRFLKRQEMLSLRRGDGTCHLRLSAINKDTLNHYYDLVGDVLATPQIKTGKARMLTSSECIAILEEKERKKKAEVEEEERRKLEREAKKKEKEEEKRRKAGEKAKEKAKKAEGNVRGPAAKTASKKAVTTTRAAKRKNEAAEPLAKRAKYSEEEVEVDCNTCSICFGSYEEDLLSGGGDEWLQCTCGKWVHEECVEDCEADSDGNPRFCPSCVEQYM